MKRKIIFAMLLICISLTACKTEKTVTDESTNTVVEEQDEESITVSENDPSIELFNSSQGTVAGYEVQEVVTDADGQEIVIGSGEEAFNEFMEEVDKMVAEGKVTDGSDTLTAEKEQENGAVEFTVTPMDATMYAATTCNVRKGPDANAYEKINTLYYAKEVKVTGKVNEADWYQVSLDDGTTGFVSASLLTETKPAKVGNNRQDWVSENGNPINPETGEEYKPGDVMTHDGAGKVYMGRKRY